MVNMHNIVYEDYYIKIFLLYSKLASEVALCMGGDTQEISEEFGFGMLLS